MGQKISIDDKIFVAGARGMAGSAICRLLRKKGYGDIQIGGALLTPTREELNLLDLNQVKRWFLKNKPDIVIIAAAKVGGIISNSTLPADFLLENIKIQTNIIETAFNLGVKRLLFLGSSCIYPKLAEQPISEDSLLNGELEKTNQWYAIAKIAGIKLCQALRLQYEFDAICLIPTNLYGPGDNYHPTYSHVMASLMRKFYIATKNKTKSVNCWGSGFPRREFLHVDDLADAVVFALEYWDPMLPNNPKDNEGNPLVFLNVGTGKDISIKELASKIANATQFHGEIIWDTQKPDGSLRKLLNIIRIKELGWAYKIDLDSGIQKTVSELYKVLD